MRLSVDLEGRYAGYDTTKSSLFRTAKNSRVPNTTGVPNKRVGGNFFGIWYVKNCKRDFFLFIR